MRDWSWDSDEIPAEQRRRPDPPPDPPRREPVPDGFCPGCRRPVLEGEPATAALFDGREMRVHSDDRGCDLFSNPELSPYRDIVALTGRSLAGRPARA